MIKHSYIVKDGSLAERFRQSRNKIQIIGGGFGNGKTTNVCIRALELAREYPGSNGLMARSTYPKLNDTLRKEFLKWCPKNWIKSFPMSNNGSNTCTLTNGSTINFRYVQQTTRGEETGTSNLLSATYDWIVVDQIEDPEIVEKDFLDLLGRLRGKTPYIGTDPTMPRSGPRFCILTCNPTRNWFYKKVVRPYHMYMQSGKMQEGLLVERDEDGKVVLGTDGKPHVLLDLFEGSTYENAHILDRDFIMTLESTYTGQMRERFLLGHWGAYEGLVYPEYNDLVHTVDTKDMIDLLQGMRANGYNINFFEGYDFGLASPSCYGLWFVDNDGNAMLLDGYYQKELDPGVQSDRIRAIRSRWSVDDDNYVFADPSIFRRTGGNTSQDSTVAALFEKNGIRMRRGNNDVLGGIAKVSSYLHIRRFHRNPFSGMSGAPSIFVSRDLGWFADEIGNYYWAKDGKGEMNDKPNDKNDHAMDMTKYALTDVPDVSRVDDAFGPGSWQQMPWRESDIKERHGSWRHRRMG